MSILNKVGHYFKWIDKWVFEAAEKFVVAFGLLALSIIVCAIVVTRYFFDYSPDWSDELPRFLLVWITFFGMSYCVRKGEHVVIDVLFNKLNGKIKKTFYMLIVGICFLFFVYMTYIGYQMTVRFFTSSQTSVALGISMGYMYLAVPLGCFLTAKNYLHIIIRNIVNAQLHTDLDERRDS
nr:TRAP transporter small permease [Bacillus sp. ISL-37]